MIYFINTIDIFKPDRPGKPVEKQGRKAKGSKALSRAMTAWPAETGYFILARAGLTGGIKDVFTAC